MIRNAPNIVSDLDLILKRTPKNDLGSQINMQIFNFNWNFISGQTSKLTKKMISWKVNLIKFKLSYD